MTRTAFAALLALACTTPALAEETRQIGYVNTALTNLGLTRSHRVVVERFNDPDVTGVSCYISQARTGGVAGSFGMAEDPSQFSIACRQIGPITLPAKLPRQETVFSEDTSLLFKETRVVRSWDEKRRTLIYLAISRKLINGAPANSISTVPVAPWSVERTP